MKGTTSSILKNTNGNSAERSRKTSAPDIHKAKGDDVPKFTGKGLVAQRAKGFETFSKNNSQKNTDRHAAHRGKSAERQKFDNPDGPVSPRLLKSKSVDEVNLIPDKTFKAANTVDIDVDKTDNSSDSKPSVTKKPEQAKTETVTEDNKSRTQVLKKSAPPPISPKPKRKVEVNPVKQSGTNNVVEKEKVKTQESSTPKSPVRSDIEEIKAMSKNPKGFVKKVPDAETDQKSETGDDDTVVSQGQFLTLGENPFIKNDVRRRNSFKEREGESVWEKESRSRDSSLKRSNSFEGEKPQKDTKLRRSNTSVGERSSLTQLSWSDSGSSGSLASPKSHKGMESNLKKSGSGGSFHGSYTNLDMDQESGSPVKARSGSVSSSTSQNSMLNLLNSPSSKRDVVTGAIETDIDAAYTEYVKSKHEDDKDKPVHDEASVEKSHLEFAKKACDLLEFEIKTRDSSSDSNDNKKGGKTKVVNDAKTVDKTEMNNNNNKPPVKAEDPSERQGKKGKKSFLKGKLFKK